MDELNLKTSSKNTLLTENSSLLTNIDEKSKVSRLVQPNEESLLLGESNNKSSCQNLTGIFYGLISTTLISFDSLFQNLLKDYGALNVSLWRFTALTISSLFPLIYYYKVKKVKVFQTLWPLDNSAALITFSIQFIIGTLLFSQSVLLLYSYEYISIGDASVIGSTSLIFVYIGACIFLKEDCGIVPIIAGIISIFGTIVISKPDYILGITQEPNNQAAIGVIYALAATLCQSISNILLRYSRDTHFTLTFFSCVLISTFESIFFISINSNFEFIDGSAKDTTILLLSIVFAFFSKIIFIISLSHEGAGVITFILSLAGVLTYALQIIFLGQIPDWTSIGGGSIIIVSVMLVTARKILMEMAKENKYRKFFNFLTI